MIREFLEFERVPRRVEAFSDRHEATLHRHTAEERQVMNRDYGSSTVIHPGR